MDPLNELAQRVGQALLDRGLMLAAAESCTGGWVAQAVTTVPGSSGWFERGFVTYSNLAKQQMLGVAAATLAAHGAVSEQVAREMATGALAHSAAQVSLAVTGIAGPEGGSPEKPVGTVWLAWAAAAGSGAEHAVRVRLSRYGGDREAVRRQSVRDALQGVLDLLAERAPAGAAAPGNR